MNKNANSADVRRYLTRIAGKSLLPCEIESYYIITKIKQEPKCLRCQRVTGKASLKDDII